MKTRDYASEKRIVYDKMCELTIRIAQKTKDVRLFLSQLTEETGLPKAAVANALRWLKTKGLVMTKDDRDGWFPIKMRKPHYAKYCWDHGLVKVTKGKKVFCPICERGMNR